MKQKMKKWYLTGGIFSAIFFLSGCMSFNESGQAEGFFSELMYDYLLVPTQSILQWLGEATGSYGFAIIIVTVVIRVIILPLSLRQQKSMMESQIKMEAIKPVTDEIQAEMNSTNDPQEKQSLQTELMEVYRENDVSMFGQLTGCLPMLLQMPVFIAMYEAINRSTEIASATWLGITLGDTSILLAVLTTLVYLLQARLMKSSMAQPNEQAGASSMMTYMTPLMMGFFSLSTHAGLGLYWFAGGFVAIAQSLLTNYYYKPKIEAELKEKHGDIEVIERKDRPRNQKQTLGDSATDIPTPAPSAKDNRQNNSPFQKKRRNEGKQRR